uniref:Pleurocidin-like peptide GC3.8 n=1 Tax=Glyptocephalus cynoglossus TaxID=34819 RepID=Q7SZG8_GLYCY|nr:pleurocidin-like peptide GC3.8 [Glyptocephalus cynoglossus]
MKFTATFLVLFMVVLMAGSGECGWKKWLRKGAKHLGQAAIKGLASCEEQQELDKRSMDDEPSAIVFD